MRILPLFLALLGWHTADAGEPMGSAYEFSFVSIAGQKLPLSSFQGKVILVVNTASHCGFTSQYQSLEKLWRTYKDEGLVILAIPSGDFGGQEFGTNKEIKKFCDINYGRTFPMTEKSKVKGNGRHPFFAWAEDTLGGHAKPRWNFHKYLIDGNGKLVDWFSTPTKPMSKKVRRAIETQLSLLGKAQNSP